MHDDIDVPALGIEAESPQCSVAKRGLEAKSPTRRETPGIRKHSHYGMKVLKIYPVEDLEMK